MAQHVIELEESLLQKIEDLHGARQRIIKGLDDELNAELDKWVKLKCPFVEGNEYDLFGYDKGKRGKATSVYAEVDDYGHFDVSWIVVGNLLKKDGSISQRRFNFRQWQWDNHLKKSKEAENV